jgi:hypothetical protein
MVKSKGAFQCRRVLSQVRRRKHRSLFWLVWSRVPPRGPASVRGVQSVTRTGVSETAAVFSLSVQQLFHCSILPLSTRCCYQIVKFVTAVTSLSELSGSSRCGLLQCFHLRVSSCSKSSKTGELLALFCYHCAVLPYCSLWKGNMCGLE